MGAKLPEVESLSGLAILLVVLFRLHAMAGGRSFATPADTSLAGAFVLAGHTGVIHFPLIWYVFDRRHGTLGPVLDAWGVPPVARPGLVFAVAIVLAALGYRVIERPFLGRAKAPGPHPAQG